MLPKTIKDAQVTSQRRLLYPLVRLTLALAPVLVLVFMCTPSVEPETKVTSSLEAAEILNGDFGEGLLHWNVESRATAEAESEVFPSGRLRTFARFTNPPDLKISAYFGQELNLRRLHAEASVQLAADFRIPLGGGPATIVVNCIDEDADRTEADYGQLQVAISSPAPADGTWHTEKLDFVVPAVNKPVESLYRRGRGCQRGCNCGEADDDVR